MYRCSNIVFFPLPNAHKKLNILPRYIFKVYFKPWSNLNICVFKFAFNVYMYVLNAGLHTFLSMSLGWKQIRPGLQKKFYISVLWIRMMLIWIRLEEKKIVFWIFFNQKYNTQNNDFLAYNSLILTQKMISF